MKTQTGRLSARHDTGNAKQRLASAFMLLRRYSATLALAAVLAAASERYETKTIVQDGPQEASR